MGWLTAAFWLLPGLAVAQETVEPERFFPLHVGNRWVYHVERIIWQDISEEGEVTWAYAEQLVVGDTTIAGEAWKKIRLRRYSTAGELLEEGSIPMRIWSYPDGGTFAWTKWPDTLPFPPVAGTAASHHTIILLDGCAGSGSNVTIGGRTYSVVCSYGVSDHIWTDGGGRGSECSGTWMASDIGMTRYLCGYGFEPPYISETSTLVYANVEGRTYGTDPVATRVETAPSEPPLLATAFPNPFSATVSLRLSLPQASAPFIEVFDMLGRSRHAARLGMHPAGTVTIRLDASAWPAGTYVVQIRAGSSQISRRIVHSIAPRTRSAGHEAMQKAVARFTASG